MTSANHHQSSTQAFMPSGLASRAVLRGLALALLVACGNEGLPDASALRPEPLRPTALVGDDTLSTSLRASMRATVAEIRAAQGHPRFSGAFFVGGRPVSVAAYIAYLEQMARDGRVPAAPGPSRGPRVASDGVSTLSCTNDPYAVAPDPDCEVGGGQPIDSTGQGTGDLPLIEVAPSEALDVAGTAAIYNANFSGTCRDIITRTITFGVGAFVVAAWHGGSYDLGYVMPDGRWISISGGGISGFGMGSTAESETKKTICLGHDVDYRSGTWHNARSLRFSVARELLVNWYSL